ncbi:MAG: hypothetical protein JWO56_3719, partial [Acidobacteria bacterium]|nr:hypothetical protein [Acidobacteriota bacterium]
DYRWSSYRATAGLEPAPDWLAVDSIAPHFGEADSWRANYHGWVTENVGSEERLWEKLTNGIYLGTTIWLKTIRKKVEEKPRSDEYPATQRAVGCPKMADIIVAVAKSFSMSADTIRHGHGGLARMVTAWLGRWEGLARLRSIAACLRLDSCGRVSDLIRECEQRLQRNPDLQAFVDRAYATLAA